MILPDSLLGQFSGKKAHLQRHQKALFSGHRLLNLELESLRCRTCVGDAHGRMLPRDAAALPFDGVLKCSKPKRKGHPGTGQPFLLGRIVPTEGEALTVKTFLAEIL
jgi:hypothetical protein